MGQVWRATDVKLKRDVAIKVLPAAFTEDAERLARFEREAQLLAQLQHPNIASIYGMEESDGTVEGPTLAERLESGALPLSEVLSIAKQIAEALEEAHEKGIVHRDLKPQNVKASIEGKVKVLDFGLAKAMDPAVGASGAGSASQLAASPTLTLGATQMGVILGTAAYMAPEQAKGIAVDKRADIWAFGVLLYEMLTGRRLFEGDSVPETLAGVLKSEIDLDALPAETPAAIRRLLRRCLERQPKNRLHDIADARIELTDVDVLETRQTVAPGERSSALAALPWVVAALALGLGAWAWLGGRGTTEAPEQVVANLAPPPGTSFLVSSGLAISPDGSQVVFGARDEAGVDQLWLQSLRDGSARPIRGTEGGRHPFWSPDSRALGFFDDRHLKRVTLSDGVVETFHDTRALRRPGGTWSRQGVILFSSGDSLFRVPAAGGEVEAVSTVGPSSSGGAVMRAGEEYLCPVFLPDGVHFLYLLRNYADAEPKRELRVGSLDDGAHKPVMRTNANAVYAPSGELAWWQDGDLRAQPFDLERLELTGTSRLVRSGVQFDPRKGLGLFSVAGDGTLVYREGGVVSGDQLALVGRSGEALGPIGPPGNYYHPRLSPDGTAVAVDQSDETNRGDIWIYDVARGTGTRLTSSPEDESAPVWSPDGRRLVFSSLRDADLSAIHIRSLRGVDDESLLQASPDGSLSPFSWSAQGAIVVAQERETGPRLFRGLGFYSVAEGTFEPAADSRFAEFNGSFSPDGRFLAFDSNETGQREVYVRPFPVASDRWRVSTDGGSAPHWRADGRELYFLNGSSELVAIPVDVAPNGSSLSFGEPETLFAIELKDSSRRQIDTIDGRTFVVNRTVGDVDATPLTLVVNGLSRGAR
jgi:Tol biopolymer transport system component